MSAAASPIPLGDRWLRFHSTRRVSRPQVFCRRASDSREGPSGWAQQIPLAEVTSELSAHGSRCRRLNTFRNRANAERGGGVDDGGHHVLPRLGRLEALNHRLVKLQIMRGHGRHFQKPSLSGPEVVVHKLRPPSRSGLRGDSSSRRHR